MATIIPSRPLFGCPNVSSQLSFVTIPENTPWSYPSGHGRLAAPSITIDLVLVLTKKHECDLTGDRYCGLKSPSTAEEIKLQPSWHCVNPSPSFQGPNEYRTETGGSKIRKEEAADLLFKQSCGIPRYKYYSQLGNDLSATTQVRQQSRSL